MEQCVTRDVSAILIRNTRFVRVPETKDEESQTRELRTMRSIETASSSQRTVSTNDCPQTTSRRAGAISAYNSSRTPARRTYPSTRRWRSGSWIVGFFFFHFHIYLFSSGTTHPANRHPSSQAHQGSQGRIRGRFQAWRRLRDEVEGHGDSPLRKTTCIHRNIGP